MCFASLDGILDNHPSTGWLNPMLIRSNYRLNNAIAMQQSGTAGSLEIFIPIT
jgi:hypothetical protein